MAGPIPVSFQEIESWSRATGKHVPGYEFSLLKQLSKDYVSQYRASSKPEEPIPMAEGEHANREQVARGLANLIAQQKAKPKR